MRVRTVSQIPKLTTKCKIRLSRWEQLWEHNVPEPAGSRLPDRTGEMRPKALTSTGGMGKCHRDCNGSPHNPEVGGSNPPPATTGEGP